MDKKRLISNRQKHLPFMKNRKQSTPAFQQQLSWIFLNASETQARLATTFKFYLGHLEELYEDFGKPDDEDMPTLLQKFEVEVSIMQSYGDMWEGEITQYLSHYSEKYKKMFELGVRTSEECEAVVKTDDYSEKVWEIAKSTRYTYSKKLPSFEERMDFLRTCNEEFAELIEDSLVKYDRFCNMVKTLGTVLEKCREDNFDTLLLMKDKNAVSEAGNETAYQLFFREFQSELWVNEYKIRRCNVKSDFGDAIMRALNSPDKTTKVSENMAQNVSALKIPQELRRMMFRIGSGTMKISPIITYAEIKDAGLDVKVLNEKFKEILGKIS